MSLKKHKRWANKDYLKFVSELPCANCGIKDGTIVPHHLRHRYNPYSGGAAYKASDIFVMPLCFECHDKLHNGDRDVVDWQAEFIFKTLDNATQSDIIQIEYKPYEYNVI